MGTQFCPSCGVEIGPEARFCRRCGKPLDETAGPPVSFPTGRSGSITALGVVTAIMGAFPLLGGLILCGAGLFSKKDIDGWSWLLAIIGVLLALLGGAEIAAGVALIRRRKWARIFVLCLGVFTGFSTLGAVPGLLGVLFLPAAFSMLVSGSYTVWVFIALLGARGKAEFQ